MARCLRLVVPASIAALMTAARAEAQVPDSTKKDSVYALPPIEVVGSILPFAGHQHRVGHRRRVDQARLEPGGRDRAQGAAGRAAAAVGHVHLRQPRVPYKINVSTRGFYASPVVGTPQGISIFVDGVRVNEPDAAEVNFDLLPLEHVKRVEILSGNGTLLGRNSLGGSINLVTRRGEGPPNGEIELMAGTYDSYSAEGSVGATTKSGLDYYVGGNYNYEKGWRQCTRADQWQGFANVGKLGQTSGIRGQFFFSHSVRRDGRFPPDVGVRGDARLQPDRR